VPLLVEPVETYSPATVPLLVEPVETYSPATVRAVLMNVSRIVSGPSR
jgi:hypothetical protein